MHLLFLDVSFFVACIALFNFSRPQPYGVDLILQSLLHCWKYVRVFYHFFPCIFIVFASFYRYRVVFIVLVSYCLNCGIIVLILSYFCSIQSLFVRGVVANFPLIYFTKSKQTHWRRCRITMEVLISHTPQHANQAEKGRVHAKLNRQAIAKSVNWRQKPCRNLTVK